jgi:hypothetical protein
VLIARNEHFAISFTRFRERNETELVIPNHNAQVFEAFLHYLYFDTIDPALLSDNMFCAALLVLADEYQDNRLKALCELALKQKVELINVVPTFEDAMRFNAQQLAQYCKDFIARNFEALQEIDAFAELDPMLVVDLAENYEAKKAGRVTTRQYAALLYSPE